MKLKIGIDKSNPKNFIELTDSQKRFNTAFIGCSKEQKTDVLYPILAKNAAASTGINTADACGSTFIVNNIDDSYLIFAVVKRMMKAKKVVLIKPSNDSNIYHEIINDEPYDYDRFNSLINYSMHVKNKSILIVDAEEYKYGELAKKFIAKLLLHIWISIQNEKTTLGRSNILYLDNADGYLDLLENILRFGNNFNLSTMLFIKDRSNLSKENKLLLDTSVENKFLFNALTKEDNDFYNALNNDSSKIERYFIAKIREDKTYIYTILEGILIKEFKDSEMVSLKDSAKKLKREDVVSDNGVPIAKQINDFNLLIYSKSSSTKVIVDSQENIKKINSEDYKEVIVATILKAKEPYNGEIFHLTLTDAQKKHIEHIKEQQMVEKTDNSKQNKEINEKIESKKEKVDEIKESPKKDKTSDSISNTMKKDNKQIIKEKESKKLKEIKEDDNENDENIKITIERPSEINPFDEALENSLEGIIDRNIAESDNGMIDDEPLIIDEDEDLVDIQEISNNEDNITNNLNEIEPIEELTRAPEQITPGTTIIDINDLLMDDDE